MKLQRRKKSLAVRMAMSTLGITFILLTILSVFVSIGVRSIAVTVGEMNAEILLSELMESYPEVHPVDFRFEKYQYSDDRVYILDSDNKIVYSRPNDQAGQPLPDLFPEAQRENFLSHRDDSNIRFTLANLRRESLAMGKSAVIDGKKLFFIVDIPNKDLFVVTDQFTKIYTFLGLSLLLIVLIGTFVQARLLLNPLNSVIHLISKLSDGNGDLTQKLPDSFSKELTKLSGGINLFTDQLRNIVMDIRASVETGSTVEKTLTASTEELSATINQIDASTGSIQSQISQLNTKIEFSSQEVRDIDQEISELQDGIHIQGQAVGDAYDSIQAMITSVKQVAEVVQTNGSTVEALVIKAEKGSGQQRLTMEHFRDAMTQFEEIQNMLSLIDNISAQTNILSMNAAIEAAHAGEAGKGFAVVADEIRKLADSSRHNSKAISDSIQLIIDKVNTTSENAEMSENAFYEIAAQIKEFDKDLQGISRNTNTLSAGSSQILGVIQNLKTSFDSIDKSTQRINNRADKVSESMGSLTTISGDVNLAISEIKTGIEEFSNTIHSFLSLMNDLEASSETLSSRVNQFVV